MTCGRRARPRGYRTPHSKLGPHADGTRAETEYDECILSFKHGGFGIRLPTRCESTMRGSTRSRTTAFRSSSLPTALWRCASTSEKRGVWRCNWPIQQARGAHGGLQCLPHPLLRVRVIGTRYLKTMLLGHERNAWNIRLPYPSSADNRTDRSGESLQHSIVCLPSSSLSA